VLLESLPLCLSRKAESGRWIVSASHLVTMTCAPQRSTEESERTASHTGIVANNAAAGINTSGLGGGSYSVGIALGGVGGCLLDNLGGCLGSSGIGVLDVVTCGRDGLVRCPFLAS
jgi:hypothetical protein